jgi:hypothetical protein
MESQTQVWTVRLLEGRDLPFYTAQEAFDYVVRKRPRGAKLYGPDGSVLISVGEARPDA